MHLNKQQVNTMKKLLVLLLFVFAVSAFAQRGGSRSAGPSASTPRSAAPAMRTPASPGPAPRFSQAPTFRPNYRPMPLPVRPMPRLGRPPIVIRPGYYGGYYYGYYGGLGWNYYLGLGFFPYYYPYYYELNGNYDQYRTPPQPCKKETLKDSNGKKHDVLVCVQPDGSMKVVADANLMIPVPLQEFSQPQQPPVQAPEPPPLSQK